MVLAAVIALLVLGTTMLEAAINPDLALMLHATFLQVPLAALRRAFGQGRFLPAIIVTQTLVELVSELIYVRLIAKLGAEGSRAHDKC